MVQTQACKPSNSALFPNMKPSMKPDTEQSTGPSYLTIGLRQLLEAAKCYRESFVWLRVAARSFRYSAQNHCRLAAMGLAARISALRRSPASNSRAAESCQNGNAAPASASSRITCGECIIPRYFSWVQFFKVQNRLMQLVDFHDRFRYFSHVLLLGERDSLGRCGVRLAPRSNRNGKTGDVVGETPTTAVETTALPTKRSSGLDGVSAHRERRLVPTRGSIRASSISTIVLDFSSVKPAQKWRCKLPRPIHSRSPKNHKLTRRPSLIKYTAAL